MWVSAAALAAQRESLTRSEATRKLYWVLGAGPFFAIFHLAFAMDGEGNINFRITKSQT